MRNLAIIPARSGSKGLKDKNIRMLAGKPLIAYSIEAAEASGMFSEVMVSTDSDRYATIAREWGAEVPWLRDADLSSDTAASWDVVRAELVRYAQRNQYFDTVCLLQPTSPLRTAEDIAGSYRLLEEREAAAVTSVCEMEHSPLLATTLDETLSLSDFRSRLATLPSLRRQDLPRHYRLNGAIYVRRVSYDGGVTLVKEPEVAYLMESSAGVDIDGLTDFYVAEAILSALQAQ